MEAVAAAAAVAHTFPILTVSNVFTEAGLRRSTYHEIDGSRKTVGCQLQVRTSIQSMQGGKKGAIFRKVIP